MVILKHGSEVVCQGNVRTHRLLKGLIYARMIHIVANCRHQDREHVQFGERIQNVRIPHEVESCGGYVCGMREVVVRILLVV